MVVTGSHERNIGVALIRAYEWFDTALLDWMHVSGYHEFTRASSMVFSYLDPEGTRPADIARRIGISRQAVHKTLIEMVETGLVELVPDPNDQRAKVVVLTPRGQQQVSTARRVLAQIERELEARIGSDRMACLREALAVDWGDPPAPQTNAAALSQAESE